MQNESHYRQAKIKSNGDISNKKYVSHMLTSESELLPSLLAPDVR